MTIFNILVRKVRILVNEMQSVGNYSIRWDGTDRKGKPVASRVYFYRIKAGDFIKSKKMTVLK